MMMYKEVHISTTFWNFIVERSRLGTYINIQLHLLEFCEGKIVIFY